MSYQVGHDREALIRKVLSESRETRPQVESVIDQATHQIQDLVSLLDERDPAKIGPQLDIVYNILDEVGDSAWRIAESTDLMEHLMRLLYPITSPELFCGALVIFSDCLLENPEACQASEKAGFVSTLFDITETGEFPLEATNAVIYAAGLILSELPAARRKFMTGHLLEKSFLWARRASSFPEYEMAFLVEQVFLDPVDMSVIDIVGPFLVEMLGKAEKPDVQDRALRALIQGTKSFHPLSKRLIEGGWHLKLLNVLKSDDWDVDVRVTALCLLRRLLDYDKKLTDGLISVDILNVIADIVKSRNDLAERAFVAVSQLMLNDEVEVASRIMSSSLFEVICGVLREGNYGSSLSAGILLASLLRNDNIEISLAVYSGAFDDIYMRLLECEKENLIVEACDALVTFICNLQKGGHDDTVSEVFQRDWLLESIDSISTEHDASGLLASFTTTLKTLSEKYV